MESLRVSYCLFITKNASPAVSATSCLDLRLESDNPDGAPPPAGLVISLSYGVILLVWIYLLVRSLVRDLRK